MDLKPSFGHHELLESLSNNSSTNKSATSGKSVQQVDEAYRKLGRRLSLQAHGGVAASAPVSKEIRQSETSGFEVFVRPTESNESEAGSGGERNHKVAKSSYEDHGEHYALKRKQTPNILRKVTMEGKEQYAAWYKAFRKEQRREMRRVKEPDTDPLSPHRQAFSRLALDSAGGPGSFPQHSFSLDYDSRGNKRTQGKSLLSAVIEGNSDSNTTSSFPATAHSGNFSISTKDSKTIASSIASSRADLPKGRCLTSPSEPVSNDGKDNVDGNLILHENDSLRIPVKSVRVLDDSKFPKERAEFRVRSLLGQGTFAQVFRCEHVQSGRIVAVKIVKNKPAFTRQSTTEIDVFRALNDSKSKSSSGVPDSLVTLLCYFMHRSHLCLVFEQLGQNLYEILKQRQFRGLPLTCVQSIVSQILQGLRDISQKHIVHSDLKPENILLTSLKGSNDLIAAGESRKSHAKKNSSTCSTKECCSSGIDSTSAGENLSHSDSSETFKVKLIDFGSASFEGYVSHDYIQSRFYRSPEVLTGQAYDSVIDMWSLGCVAAELFLGLPILPGIHEHDQLCRITEMIAALPEWMLDHGTKVKKYYIKFLSKPMASPGNNSTPPVHQWRLKTQKEYIASLSKSDVKNKGGMKKLEQQPGNRYFKRKLLADIMMLYGSKATGSDKMLLPAFVHFVHGLLEPDPWKRWSSFQAIQHPFLTGDLDSLVLKTSQHSMNSKGENQANVMLSTYWEVPYDPQIRRRKLLIAQRTRERHHSLRRASSASSFSDNAYVERGQKSPLSSDETPITSDETRTRNSSSRQSSYGYATPPMSVSHVGSYYGGYSGEVASTSMQEAYETGGPVDIRSVNYCRRNSHDIGSQSLNTVASLGSNVMIGGDFAQALRRPGIIPTDGSEASPSVRSDNNERLVSHQFGSQPLHQNRVESHSALSPTHYQSRYYTAPQQTSTFVQPTFPSNFYCTDTGDQHSAVSSVSMSDAVSLDATRPFVHPPLMQGSQAHGMEHVMINQSQMIPMQQQLFLATAPDGSTFYVTAAHGGPGQPMMLQPVSHVGRTGVAMSPMPLQGMERSVPQAQQVFAAQMPPMMYPVSMTHNQTQSNANHQARFNC